MTHKTLCPYCGVGCGLEVSATSNNWHWKVRGDRSHPSSHGMVCVKGATATEPLHQDRLRYPMLRQSLAEPFQQVSWDEALDAIVNRIHTVLSNSGPDAICMYGSGQSTIEDYYVAQKLIKGCLGSNNFDSNSRLCMASAVSAYVQSFGCDGPPCCYDDLELTDCAFLIGSNAAECHPIIFNRLQKHHKHHSDVKLIVVDPRRTTTAEAADLHLPIRPGTDIDLLNGIAYLLLHWGYVDTKFIEQCTNNFPAFVEVIKHYPPEVVARRCGIAVSDLEQAAAYWGRSQRVLSMWLLGLNQSIEGTAKARTLINLHLMTGQIGKPGCGPFSLTGQPNAMGGRIVGGNNLGLPGYRSVTNPQERQEVEQFWRLPAGQISPVPGRTAWDIITGLEHQEVEFLWIYATNPAVSMPDLERTKAAFSLSPFTVYQEIYHPTETAAYAHLLLPATGWSEKTGTMINSERRVTLTPAFRSPGFDARDDWEIFAEVGRRLGFTAQFSFTTAAEVYAEFVQLTRNRLCDLTGTSHEQLQTNPPVQWPCPDSGQFPSGLARLYTDLRFPTPDGKARFAAYHSRGLAEPPDQEYPFVLINGRLYGHWHTQTRTGRIHKIRSMHPQPFIEIHPHDAKTLGVEEDSWVEVRSRRGKAKFSVTITEAVSPGTVFVPMHWGNLWAEEAEANVLTHPESCPESLQPELKACAVQILPITVKLNAAQANVSLLFSLS